MLQPGVPEASAAAKAGLEAAEANRIAKEANGIASDSNAIAARAAQDAREAPTDIAWDALVVALADIQTFDASGTEDPGKRRTTLRTRIQLLLDRLPWTTWVTGWQPSRRRDLPSCARPTTVARPSGGVGAGR